MRLARCMLAALATSYATFALTPIPEAVTRFCLADWRVAGAGGGADFGLSEAAKIP